MASCRPRPMSAVAAVLAFAVFAGVPQPAASEVYRWTDEQGELHFTSDLNRVPPQFRDQVASRPAAAAHITVLGSEENADSDVRAQAVQERLSDLRKRQRQQAEQNQKAAPPPPKADPEPQKYEYNCQKRTKNGRCQRFRTAAWDAWNERQQRQQSPE